MTTTVDNRPCLVTRRPYGKILEYLSDDLERTGSVLIVIDDDDITKNTNHSINFKDFHKQLHGNCYYCGNHCNISSQLCGICARYGRILSSRLLK